MTCFYVIEPHSSISSASLSSPNSTCPRSTDLLVSALSLVPCCVNTMCTDHSVIAGKTLNTYLTTSDNQTLGAWFVLSEDYYQANVARAAFASPIPSTELIRDTLQQHPTILFLHGAAGTRAVSWRVAAYQSFTSRLHANVLAVDYRGFGDSAGVPSEDGLELDAYAAWNWLLEHGAKAEDIVIIGHSLGTGVAGRFMTSLHKEGIKPRGVALLAPFSTLGKLIETYSIFNIPILQPLQMFPIGISKSAASLHPPRRTKS